MPVSFNLPSLTAKTAICFSTLNCASVSAVGREDDPLPRLAAWQICGPHRLAVADFEQQHASVRVPAGVVEGQVGAVHRLHGNPPTVRRNGNPFGDGRHGDMLHGAERPLGNIDQRERIRVAKSFPALAKPGKPTLPTTAHWPSPDTSIA